MHTDTNPHPSLDMATSTESQSPVQETVQHQDTSSPSHQLDQLRIALCHPLSPAGTTKHEELEEEDVL